VCFKMFGECSGGAAGDGAAFFFGFVEEAQGLCHERGEFGLCFSKEGDGVRAKPGENAVEVGGIFFQCGFGARISRAGIVEGVAQDSAYDFGVCCDVGEVGPVDDGDEIREFFVSHP